MSQNSGKQLNNWPLLAGLAEALVPPHPLPGPQYKLHHGGAYLWNLQTSAILTLRVYALFNRNRVILGLLSLGGLGSLAIGVVHTLIGSEAPPTPRLRSPEVRACFLMSRIAGAWEAGNPILIAAVDVANILIYYFGDVNWLTYGKPFLAGSLAWLASALSAVLTARLILNMREVADTDGMAVGDVASEDADTMEWNDIDGTPMEHIRGRVRNRASWGYGNDLE
ncbi:hypothetical protein B0H13DRAFT_1873340 [Mycena leptocephala]|nr:hypothetical protein B0H13DRAFT_1873340 [Mycena leptocephala]